MLVFRKLSVWGVLLLLPSSTVGTSSSEPPTACTLNVRKQVYSLPVQPYSGPDATQCPAYPRSIVGYPEFVSWREDVTQSVPLSSSSSSTSIPTPSLAPSRTSQMGTKSSADGTTTQESMSIVPTSKWVWERMNVMPTSRRDFITSRKPFNVSLLDALKAFRANMVGSPPNITNATEAYLAAMASSPTLMPNTPGTIFSENGSISTNSELLTTRTWIAGAVVTLYNGTTLQRTTVEPTGFDNTNDAGLATTPFTSSVAVSTNTTIPSAETRTDCVSSDASSSILSTTDSECSNLSLSTSALSISNVMTSINNVTAGTIVSTQPSITDPVVSAPPTPSIDSSSAMRYRGFNFVNQSPSRLGQLKNQLDWETAFWYMRQVPGDFNAIRLYSTTDGAERHLLNALPAARKYNLSVHVGVWSGGKYHVERFKAEKSALDDALKQLGCGNIVAVSVGNEDMYSARLNGQRDESLASATLLVNQVQEIKDVLNKYNCVDVKMTHTDTFGEWLMTNVSEPLIRKVDFLTVNIFPYWESQSIDVAANVFWEHVEQTAKLASSYGKDIWIGETGWPVQGTTMGEAVANQINALRYWKEVGCSLRSRFNSFWYVEWDRHQSTNASSGLPPSFSLLDDGTSIVGNLTCP